MKNRLTVMVGLPGSGKTTYAKNELKSYKYVDGDKFLRNKQTIEELMEHVNTLDEHVALDGLFLSEEIQNKIETLARGFYTTFVYFEPNRPACLYNDALRNRKEKASLTITKAEVHKPRNSITRKTIKYDYVGQIMVELRLSEEMKSDSWSLGGTYGTCWDEDGPTDVGPDTPDTMEEFYSYINLMKYFFEVNYLEMAEKYFHYVDTDTYGEGDYYGGYQTYEYYTLDTRMLIENILREEFDIQKFETEYVHKYHPELFI